MLHPHWKKHPCKNPICKKDLSCFSASDPHNCTEYFRCCQACKNPLSTHILHFSPGITGHFQEQKNQNKRKTVRNSYRFMHSMKKQIQSSNMKSRKIQDNQCTCRNLFHSTDLFVKKIHSCKKQYRTATIQIYVSLLAGFYKRQGILHQCAHLFPDISVNTGNSCACFLRSCCSGHCHNTRNQCNSRKTCRCNRRTGKFQN